MQVDEGDDSDGDVNDQFAMTLIAHRVVSLLGFFPYTLGDLLSFHRAAHGTKSKRGRQMARVQTQALDAIHTNLVSVTAVVKPDKRNGAKI